MKDKQYYPKSVTEPVALKAKVDAKKLLSGRVEFEDLCRYAAHNLAERKEILSELKSNSKLPVKQRMSRERKLYLDMRMVYLRVEKKFLESKFLRIKERVVSEHLFII